MGHLMTSSLLDSYDWAINAPNSWKQKANEDFISTIRRQKSFTPTQEAQRGMDFEDLICHHVELTPPDFEDLVRGYYEEKIVTSGLGNISLVTKKVIEVADSFYSRCKAGQFQQKVYRDITVDGEQFYLFGYADVMLPDKILDIKTCSSYKGESKYLKRSQHWVYMYCTGVFQFEYLVADFKRTPLPLDFHLIPIACTGGEQSAESVLKGRIHNLMCYLKSNNLWDDYITLFCREK